MICGTFSMQCGSQAEADLIAQSYKATRPPPTSVTVSPAFLVTAVWPPCTANVSHAPGGASATVVQAAGAGGPG